MNHPDIIYVDEYGNIVPVDALKDKRECVEYRRKQEWISVEDRLPENAQYVLITYKQFSYDDSVVRLGWYCAFTDKWRHGGDLVNVIHWMPLPR